MKNVIDQYLEQHEAIMARLLENRALLQELSAAIPDEWGVRLSVDAGGEVNVSFSGDKKRLQDMWKILRGLGLIPDCHIGDDMVSSFSAYWRKVPGEEAPIWMYWSSTVCRMKQTGTKMVEQAIYEVVCD